jgi:5-methylcytosine-specific restriction endonuclease McrA
MGKLKLHIELVPKTCFYSNVRTLLPNKYWDKLRKESYEKANHVCEICGDNGKNQGYNHNVECHEIWSYDDDTRTQKLLGLISLCPKCHQVKHFGRTSAIGKQPEAFKHLEKVNEWNHKQCVDHAKEAMLEWMDRSKYKWKLDLGVLTELCGEIPKKLITEAEKKRLL